MSQQSAPNKGRIGMQTWLAIGLAILGLILVVLFGLRTVRSFTRIERDRLDRPAPRVEDIRGWMTLPHLAKVFHVPEPYLYEQLGISDDAAHRMDLRELSRTQSPEAPEQFMERVKDVIRSYQPARPPP